jgi:putative hydrolase of the HAD superfamily
VRGVQLRAVIFDLGGVIVPSPIDAFRDFEREQGLPHRFISEVIVDSGDHGAWSKLERGELTLAEFGAAFEKECAAAGQTLVADDMLACLYGSEGPRPAMLAAIARIREEGLKTAALTNNWVDEDDVGIAERKSELAEAFDVIVESSREGLRKPDPRIYELTCERLGVEPSEAAFLDDLGVNLKPARAMGMTTIKVDDPDVALAELEQALGFPLSNGS